MKHEEHNLVDMKRAVGQRTPEIASKQSEYSYGLNLRLENNELGKLSIKRLPDVGDEYEIYAIGKVTNVYESQSENNIEDRAVQIQIQKLGLKKWY